MIWIFSGLLLICSVVIVLMARRIFQLSSQLHAFTLSEELRRRSQALDPGPLDREGVRFFLRHGWPHPSKTHDRVKEAFERLLRERGKDEA